MTKRWKLEGIYQLSPMVVNRTRPDFKGIEENSPVDTSISKEDAALWKIGESHHREHRPVSPNLLRLDPNPLLMLATAK